jgi:membrane associated rhomboid family serine protease
MSVRSDASDARPPLRRVIGRRIGVADVVALAVVPLVLFAVYLLPSDVRRSLVFEYTAPSAVTAVASPFVHFDATHLLVNVVTYGLVASTGLLLSVASGHRQRFYTAFLTFVVVFPGLLSYLNLAVLRLSVGFGFSGVVMAFVGYLPLALAEYVDAQFGLGSPTTVGPILFFPTLGIISVLSVQSVVPENTTVVLGTSGLVVAALLSALLYGVSLAQRETDFVWKVRRTVRQAGYFELVVASLVLIFAIPFVGFPADPAFGDGSLNLYVHLLGYALGFLSTYVTAEVQSNVVD